MDPGSIDRARGGRRLLLAAANVSHLRLRRFTIGFSLIAAGEDPIHVHDLQATIMRCLGFDHTRLTYKYMGREFRLTDVAGRVVEKLLV